MEELNSLLERSGCTVPTPTAQDECVAMPTVDLSRTDGHQLHHRHQLQQRLDQLSRCQERRRQQLLQSQKQRRDDQLSRFRDLCSGQTDAVDSHSSDTAPPVFRYKKSGRCSRFGGRLMLSEWMEGPAPPDLASDWLLKLCPPGRRCLVITGRDRVSGRACTFSYTVGGMMLRSFPSLLPGGGGGGSDSTCDGGSARHPRQRSRATLLDCIWHERRRVFHVLDILCWNGHPVDECEAEFRFAWLASKLAETAGVGDVSRHNPLPLLALPAHACAPAPLLAGVLASPESHAADGLLFYHRRGHYSSGATPLVLWLKPFMVAETLTVAHLPPSGDNTANQQQLPPPPAHYPGKQLFIDQFERERRRRSRPAQHTVAMET